MSLLKLSYTMVLNSFNPADVSVGNAPFTTYAWYVDKHGIKIAVYDSIHSSLHIHVQEFYLPCLSA